MFARMIDSTTPTIELNHKVQFVLMLIVDAGMVASLVANYVYNGDALSMHMHFILFWKVVAIGVLAYFAIHTALLSFDIQVRSESFYSRCMWKAWQRQDYAKLARIRKLSKNLTVIVLKDGTWIPLYGYGGDDVGRDKKAIVEQMIRSHLDGRSIGP